MHRKRDKSGDAVGRLRRESSLLGDPSAKFFCEKRETGTKRDATGEKNQTAGQDFFQAAVHLDKSARRMVSILTCPEWSLMAGFEVTFNGRF